MSLQTRLVRVSGRVQGVGYRFACVQKARALGLHGWVRNRSDGSVEALLQGAPAAVERMCAWMRDDVPGARVDHMETSPEPAGSERFRSFEQGASL